MQITLDTQTVSHGELTALIALCASLGGRLPDADYKYVPNRGERPETLPSGVTTAGPPVNAFATVPESERLLAEAAASRAAPPPPADEQSYDPASLDASGVPWDERIHSSNKARVADGTWRKRRGVDEVTFGQVHGELSERVAAAQAGGQPGESSTTPAITGTNENGAGSPSSTTVPTPPVPQPPVTVPAPPTADVPNVPPPPTSSHPIPAENVPTAANPTSAPAASGGGSFSAFPDLVSTVSGCNLNYNQLDQIATIFGETKFIGMRNRPECWDDFYMRALDKRQELDAAQG